MRHVEYLESKSMEGLNARPHDTRAPVSRPPLAAGPLPAAERVGSLRTTDCELGSSRQASIEELESERLDREEALRVRNVQQVP